MNIRNNIAQSFEWMAGAFRKNAITDFGFDPRITSQLLGVATTYSTTAIQNISPWAGASINLIKDSFCSLPVMAVRTDNPGEMVELQDSPLMFLEKPGQMSLMQLMEYVSFWLDVAGEAFIYAERDNPFSPPTELDVFLPFCMEDRLDSQGNLVWRYTPYLYPTGKDSKKYYRDIEPWKIIHIKNYGYGNKKGTSSYGNSGQLIRGVPPSLPILETIAMDNSLTRFLRDHLESPTTVSGVLRPSKEVKLNDKQRKELIASLKKQIAGFTRSHRTLILNSYMDFAESSMNPFDIDAAEIKTFSKEEIFAIYGTNPVVLGIFSDVKSYEGSKEAQKVFWRLKIIPRTRHFVDDMYHQLLQFINGGMWSLRFDFSQVEALDETEMMLKRAKLALSLGRTPNEVNRRYRLGFPEDVEWGDLPLPMFRQAELPTGGQEQRSLNAGNATVSDETLSRVSDDCKNAVRQTYSGLRRIFMSIRGEVLSELQNSEKATFDADRRIGELTDFFSKRTGEVWTLAEAEISAEIDADMSGFGDVESQSRFLHNRRDVCVAVVNRLLEDVGEFTKEEDVRTRFNEIFDTVLGKFSTLETLEAVRTARQDMLDHIGLEEVAWHEVYLGGEVAEEMPFPAISGTRES